MSQPHDDTAWNDCPPGALAGLSHRAQRRRLLRLAAQTVSAVAVLAIVGFGGFFWRLRRQMQEYQFFGMTCSDVRELLPDYLAGKLDEKRAEVLERHVSRCPNCAGFRPQMRHEVTLLVIERNSKPG